ncbi:hypothetical protein, partial [Escherichia coli]|uniref:hypothetical protein n=1 Tax=Escherichia coli TaxID=562 RepID=UPI001BDD277D
YVTGYIINVRSQHRNYEALQGSTGKDPTDPANAAYWLDLGPSARWAMFDTSSGSQSEYGGEIAVTVQPNGSFDSLALLVMTA